MQKCCNKHVWTQSSFEPCTSAMHHVLIVIRHPRRGKVLSFFYPILRQIVFLMVTDSPKGAGGENSSLDEDSSDALSPDQPNNHDSPLSAVPQLSPSDRLSQNGDMSPPQVKKQMKRNLKFYTQQHSMKISLP